MLKPCRGLFLTETCGCRTEQTRVLISSIKFPPWPRCPRWSQWACKSLCLTHVSRREHGGDCLPTTGLRGCRVPTQHAAADLHTLSSRRRGRTLAARVRQQPSSSSAGSAVSEERHSSGDFGRRCVGLMRSVRIINEPADLPWLWLRVCRVSVCTNSWFHLSHVSTSRFTRFCNMRSF